MAKYYTDLQVPIFTFTEILKTQDYSLLYIEEKGEEDLSKVWWEIYNQYCKKAKIDNSSIKVQGKINDLQKKQYEVKILLSFVQDEYPEVRKKARKVLAEKFNFIIDPKKPIQEEIERLKSQLESLKTKIKILQNKIPQEQKKEGISLMKEAILMEDASPGINIDIYTMSTEKWLARMEIFREKIRAQRSSRKTRTSR